MHNLTHRSIEFQRFRFCKSCLWQWLEIKAFRRSGIPQKQFITTMMMNCFCRVLDRRNALSHHHQLVIMKHSGIFIVIRSIFGIPVFFLIKAVVDLIKVLLQLVFHLSGSAIFYRKSECK